MGQDNRPRRRMGRLLFGAFGLLALAAGLAPQQAVAQGRACQETYYVPALSDIYTGGRANFAQLAITLSVRNISEAESLTLERVDYFDTSGKKLRALIEASIEVKPLETAQYLIDIVDREGGGGANFLVGVTRAAAMPAPSLDAVMFGSFAQRGISLAAGSRLVSGNCD